MKTIPKATRRRGGFSLLELLVAMTILSVLVVFLAEMFTATATRWVAQTANQETELEVRAARQWLTEDLASAYTNRPLRSSGTANFTGTFEQGEFFQDRLILPFEVNREAGFGADRSLENAEPGFDTLSFVGLRRGAGALLPETFAPSRYGHLGNPALDRHSAGEEAVFVAADAYLVAYYVAYTRDSPLPGAPSSMKLFRHFRPCGSSNGEAQATPVLRYQARALNEDLLPRAQFRNLELPFLFAFCSRDPDSGASDAATAPWPVYADLQRLSSPPSSTRFPSVSPTTWFDPDNPVQDFVPGDEPVAANVVRFEVKAYRRVEILDADGAVERVEVMDAKQLNHHLQLGGGSEWPALVAPSFVEVTLAVVGPDVAALLEKPEDWIQSWDRDDLPDDTDSLSGRLILRSLNTIRFRVPILPVS